MKKIKELKIYKMWITISTILDKYHISAYASSAAFFTFLSLIPMMILFFSIIPYTPITEATIMKLVNDIMPHELIPIAINMVHELYNKKAALLSVSLLVAIWSSAKGTLALTRGLNVINDVTEKRNYVLLRLRASVYTIIMLVMIIVLMVLVIFGESIVNVTTKTFPHIKLFFSFVLHIRVLFVIAILALFFWAVFTWLPSDVKTIRKEDGTNADRRERRKLIYELPGALFTACVWYFASWLFSEYVNRFPSFGMYGSMATIAIIMFWLYMCFYIILIGACINSIFKKAAALSEQQKNK